MLKSEYIEELNRKFHELDIPTHPNNLYEPFSYIMSLGGKRIRPQLVLAITDLYLGKYHPALSAALAVEVFHNFSLVHDDIMDNAPLRRGKPTVHEYWNPNIAILSGDMMLVKAYQILQEYPSEIAQSLMKVFSKTAIQVCEGQQLDMDFEMKQEVEIKEYIQMIQLKTAVLLGCSLQMGAIVSNASIDEQLALYQFGLNLGTAFQLQDDLLDVYGDPIVFGKQVGGDIISNKKTFLLLTALNNSDSIQKQALETALLIEDAKLKVESVTSCFNTLEIKHITEKEIKKYHDLARLNIAILPIAMQEKLNEFADALINRAY
jgi:geranylgeranyl diphosphate synthase, type II